MKRAFFLVCFASFLMHGFLPLFADSQRVVVIEGFTSTG